MYKGYLKSQVQKFSSVAKKPVSRTFMALALVAGGFAVTPTMVSANGPGRGATASFEVEFLKFVADHHLVGIRETALCTRKAVTTQLLALCRGTNAVQRGEILTAQRLLGEWYGITYRPQISAEDRHTLEDLAALRDGAQFEVGFMMEFSRHHYDLTKSALDCLVASELRHGELVKLCRDIIDFQVSDIDEMRGLLCNKYGRCDFQPIKES